MLFKCFSSFLSILQNCTWFEQISLKEFDTGNDSNMRNIKRKFSFQRRVKLAYTKVPRLSEFSRFRQMDDKNGLEYQTFKRYIQYKRYID